VEYCPTLQMLAEFQILCNQIMNYNPEQQSAQDYRSVLDHVKMHEWASRDNCEKVREWYACADV